MKPEVFVGVNNYTADIIQLLCRIVFRHNAQKLYTEDLMGFKVIPVLKSEVNNGCATS